MPKKLPNLNQVVQELHLFLNKWLQLAKLWLSEDHLSNAHQAF
ncbi:hypothetical protein CsSME_00012052 [Camellia sinensis var. sinensis]